VPFQIGERLPEIALRRVPLQEEEQRREYHVLLDAA
jgi:hypothetical protein